MINSLKITVEKTPLADLLLIKPKVFGDDRGWFYESFNAQEFVLATGINSTFVQDNHSKSKGEYSEDCIFKQTIPRENWYALLMGPFLMLLSI